MYCYTSPQTPHSSRPTVTNARSSVAILNPNRVIVDDRQGRAVSKKANQAQDVRLFTHALIPILDVLFLLRDD